MDSLTPSSGSCADSDPQPYDLATQSFRCFVQSGNREELERACLLCTGELRRAARRLLRKDDVEDAVQESLAIAIARAASFGAAGRLLPWLLGILHNVARSRHRRRWFRLQASTAEAEDTLPQRTLEDPAAEVERDDMVHHVRAAAAYLAEPYRSVVIEHLCDAVPLVTIAHRSGRPAGTVRTHFARGLEHLRRHLPTPVLVGLAAMLAARRSEAAAAAPQRMKVARPRNLALATALVAGLGAVMLLGWNGAPASPPPAAMLAVATAPDLAAGGSAPATPLAMVQLPAARETAAPMRRIRLRLLQPNGFPADRMAVFFDPRHDPLTTPARAHLHWVRAISDHDGRLEFVAAARHPAQFRITEDRVLHEVPPATEDSEHTLTIPRSQLFAMHCYGTDGHPVAGATVMAQGAWGGDLPALPVATTDTHGLASFRSPYDNTTMWILGPAHRRSHSGFFVVPAGDPVIGLSQWSLTASEQVCEGQVVGADGSPISGAVVLVNSVEGDLNPPIYLLTDEGGRFRTEALPAGAWRATAAHPGHVATHSGPLRSTEACRLQLPASRRVHGRVVGVDQARYRRMKVVGRHDAGRPDDPLAKLTTGVERDGTFVLLDAPTDHIELSLYDNSRSPMLATEIDLSEHADAPIDLIVREESLWQIKVSDEQGNPVRNAVIVCSGGDPRIGGIPACVADTDELGVARVPVTHRGNLRVAVFRRDHRPGSTFPNAIREQAAGEPLCVTLSGASAELRGRLVVEPCYALWLTQDTQRALVVQSTDGSFSVPELPATPHWRLELRNRQHAQDCAICLAEFDLTPDQHLDLGEIHVPRSGTLRLSMGEMTCAQQQVHVEHETYGTIRRWSMAPQQEQDLTLPAGRYTVSIPAATGEASEQEVVISAGALTPLRLKRDGGMPCLVQIDDSRPITMGTKAHVEIRPRRATASSPRFAFVAAYLPPRSGMHFQADLDPGEYLATVHLRDGRQVEQPFTVAPSKELQIITLRVE
jgi:DNA-directed RNA polymerase specialized sigma24 family protein